MRKIAKSMISIALAIAMFICAVVPAFAAETTEEYLCELRLIYADDYEEAMEILADSEFSDYKLLKENLNEDSGEIGVWLAYKSTTDIDDAVTDIAVMQMNGGYTEGNYQEMVQQSYDEYVALGEIYLQAIDYFIEAYDAEHFLAQSAYRQLNFYCGVDEREDERLGDVFYEGIDSSELATIFLEGNYYVLKNIRSLIAMGVAYNEDGKTYLAKVEEEAANMNEDPGVYDSESYEDLACLISPTITILKSSFKELAAYEPELNYSDETLTQTEIKYMEYKAMADMMREVDYLGGKTLYEFCCGYETNQEDYSALYPLVAALNEGQVAMTQVAHYYDVVRYSMAVYPKEVVEEKLAEYEEKYSENPFNIYTGVDRSVYDGSFALTSEASRADAYSETGLADAFFGEGNLSSTLITMYTGAVGAAIFATAIHLSAESGISGGGGAIGGALTDTAGNVATNIAETAVQSIQDQITTAINGVAHQTIEVVGYNGAALEDILNVLFLKQVPANSPMIDTWATMDFSSKFNYFDSSIANYSPSFTDDITDQFAYKLISNEVSHARHTVDTAQPAAEQATKTTVESSATASSGGMTAFAGVLYVVGGIMMLYSAIRLGMTAYNYYHPEYTDIPIAMVDLIDTVDGDRYIKYDVVFEAETNDEGEYSAADLNAFEGQRWNALYYTKSYEAGKPLLADEFSVSNKNNTPKENYAPVHRFGEVVCYDLNKYNFDDDASIYLSVKQSQKQKSAVADVPEIVGSMFGTGFMLLAGGIGAVFGIGGTLITQRVFKKKNSRANANAKA